MKIKITALAIAVTLIAGSASASTQNEFAGFSLQKIGPHGSWLGDAEPMKQTLSVDKPDLTFAQVLREQGQLGTFAKETPPLPEALRVAPQSKVEAPTPPHLPQLRFLSPTKNEPIAP